LRIEQAGGSMPDELRDKSSALASRSRAGDFGVMEMGERSQLQ